jgi:WD40 repeat protein
MSVLLATATKANNAMRLWSLDHAYNVRHEWEGTATLPSPVVSVMLAADGSILICVLEDYLQAWSMNGRGAVWKMKRNPVTSFQWFAMSRTDYRVLCAGFYNLTIVDARTGAVTSNFMLTADDMSITCATMSPDGSRIVSGHWNCIAVRDAGAFSVLHKIPTETSVKSVCCSNFAESVAFTRTAESEYHSVVPLQLWNCSSATSVQLEVCPLHTFTEDGKLLTVCAQFMNRMQLKLWDCISGQACNTVIIGDGTTGTPHSVTARGNVGILLGYDNGKVEIFDSQLRQRMQAWDAHNGSVVTSLS